MTNLINLYFYLTFILLNKDYFINIYLIINDLININKIVCHYFKLYLIN